MQVMYIGHFARICSTISRVPFGVKRLNAACGVMITGSSVISFNHTILMESLYPASHNPKVIFRVSLACDCMLIV